MSDNAVKQVTYRRLGRIKVSGDAMANWPSLKPLMKHLVVVNVTYHYDTLTYEYLAFSDLFEPLEEGIAAPLYSVMMMKDEAGNVEVQSVEKVEP